MHYQQNSTGSVMLKCCAGHAVQPHHGSLAAALPMLPERTQLHTLVLVQVIRLILRSAFLIGGALIFVVLVRDDDHLCSREQSRAEAVVRAVGVG